mmetsp:Transcript_66010/g.171304  ORF Transcript_66010/g.171304 Transcript_66010/m.171304 type:complete len:248 (+) Transcript_66010:329-1072(+)
MLRALGCVAHSRGSRSCRCRLLLPAAAATSCGGGGGGCSARRRRTARQVRPPRDEYTQSMMHTDDAVVATRRPPAGAPPPPGGGLASARSSRASAATRTSNCCVRVVGSDPANTCKLPDAVPANKKAPEPSNANARIAARHNLNRLKGVAARTSMERKRPPAPPDKKICGCNGENTAACTGLLSRKVCSTSPVSTSQKRTDPSSDIVTSASSEGLKNIEVTARAWPRKRTCTAMSLDVAPSEASKLQ